MQTIVLATILLTVGFVCTIKGVKLKNCTNRKLEVTAGAPLPIICENITQDRSVLWRHGHKAILGECYTNGSCSNFYDEYTLTREANSTNSQLEFLTNITVDNGVNISCEYRGGAMDTCTLDIKGVEIMNCRSKKLVRFENSSKAITCINIPVNNSIIWRLGANRNYIGECSSLGTCLNNMSASYRIIREKYSAESHLLIHQNLRGLRGARITCEDESGKSADTCQLVIRGHPVLKGCTINTNITRGTASGSCIVHEFFTSDNNAQCRWTMSDTRDKSLIQRHNRLISRISFIYTCENMWSCRGTCNFTSPLPQKKGVYTYTIMALDSPQATFSKNITIDDQNQTNSTPSALSTLPSHLEKTDASDFSTPFSSLSGDDFSATTLDLLDDSSSPSESSSVGNSSQLGLIIGILLAFALLTTASTAFIIFRRRKLQRQRRRQHKENVSRQRQEDFEEFINDVYQSADPNVIQPYQNT